MSSEIYTLNTDGGSRGNPGPGAAAYILKDPSGNIVKEMGIFLGECTNNEAEYNALISGLNDVLKDNIKNLQCLLDSELVVKQLNGEYKVKIPHIKVLYDKVKKLEGGFNLISYKHIRREQNSEADAMVNKVLDATLKR